MSLYRCIVCSMVCLLPSPLVCADAFSVQNGTIDFTAKSNAGFAIHGSADLASGRFKAIQKGDDLEITDLDISLPAKKFKTGMDLRDEHLYERVFKDGNGDMKDIRVSAERLACGGKGPSWDCEVQLVTEMRGVAKRLPYKLDIKSVANGFEINGLTHIPTPQYGVEKLAYMMVELEPDVEVEIKSARFEKDSPK